MTVKELLNIQENKALSVNKEVSAIRLLITETLNVDNIYLHYDDIIDEVMLIKLENDIKNYLENDYPVQYIIGHSYFYGNKFKVTPDVLIPRFDTEVVVEATIKKLKQLSKDIKIVDIGTGSGVIAITIKKHFPMATVYAVDVSSQALQVCIENAKTLNADIIIKQSDLLANVDEVFDIIISNPPYIGENDPVAVDVFKYEPHLALFANEQGLKYYHLILKQSLQKLQKNGIIIFEIGYNQAQAVTALAKQYYPNSQIELIYDLSSNPRALMIEVKK